MRASEVLGFLGGIALAPLTGFGAAVRRARLFHPEGVLYRADANPLVSTGPRGVLAERLAGQVLVRLSTSIWRGGREWLDVLGMGIRFRSEEIPSVVPSPGDQDLLLATIRTPWTTTLAPLKTHWHDFLRNDYYAVSPFTVEGLGRVKFRMVSARVRLPGIDRGARLQRAVEENLASFRLEVKKLGSRNWEPVIAMRLLERVDLDQEALRFDPFRSGRGIVPSGFVQWLRPATYWASQRFRPKSASEQTGGAVRKPRWAPVPVRMHPRGDPARPWEAAPPHRHEATGFGQPLRPPPPY